MTGRRLGSGEKTLAYLWAGSAIAVLVLRPLWSWAPAFLSPCGFRAWTGLPCFACGSTRTGLTLLDGRIAESLTYNPLAAVAATAFLAGGLVAPLWAVLDLPVPVLRGRSPAWWLVLAGLVLINWIYLIAAGV